MRGKYHKTNVQNSERSNKGINIIFLLLGSLFIFLFSNEVIIKEYPFFCNHDKKQINLLKHARSPVNQNLTQDGPHGHLL